MKALNSIRYKMFKFLDSKKEDPILKRYSEIKKVMESDNVYENFIGNQLNNLIDYACENVNYYKLYKGKKFCDFPIINKNIIMDNFDDFMSSEYQKNRNSLHKMSTSGSTGRPFEILQDKGKRNQVLADIMYFSGLVGYKTGNKLIYLRNLEKNLKKSNIKQFLQNQIVISTSNYGDNAIEKIVNQICRSEKGTTILGYASTLDMIANYMIKKDLKCDVITGIISGAETLSDKTRKKLKAIFNCPVVSRYSNQENGILAQDYDVNKFLINRASYKIEIFDLEKDELIKDTKLGRIVITDLYNKAMPMIRYDTGDIGVIEKINGKEYLTALYGRKADLLFTTKNEPITFFALDDFFENIKEIQQYQIIQKSRTELTINLIVDDGYVLDKKQAIKFIKKVMGEEMEVNFHYLLSVPITNSGKFKYVICEYKPKELK